MADDCWDRSTSDVERFGARRTVVTCHDLMPFVVPGFYRRRAEGAVKRALLRKSVRGMLSASRLITVSETTASDLVRLFGYPRERVSIDMPPRSPALPVRKSPSRVV